MEEISTMTVQSTLSGKDSMSGVDPTTIIPKFDHKTESKSSSQDVLLVQTSSEDSVARNGGLRKTVSILAIAPTKMQHQSEASRATVFVGAGGTSSVGSANSAVNPTANWTQQTRIPEVKTVNGHHGTKIQDHRKGSEEQMHSVAVVGQQQQSSQTHQTGQHVVKIRINPELDTSRVISTIHLNPGNKEDGTSGALKLGFAGSLNEEKNGTGLDKDNSRDPDVWKIRDNVVRLNGRGGNESFTHTESRVRISVVSGDIEQQIDDQRHENHENQPSERSVTSGDTKSRNQSKQQDDMIQQRTAVSENINAASINRGSAACFYYGAFPNSLTTMMMPSGQCSPSDTLDSGTCSDLDGTPPPLPKKKNSSTVLLGVDATNGSPIIGSGKCVSITGSQKQQQHNRAGSVTSSGPELDSDDNESNISCDSLNSGELASRIIEQRSIRVNGSTVPDVGDKIAVIDNHEEHERKKILEDVKSDKKVTSGEGINVKVVSDEDECHDVNDNNSRNNDIKNNNNNNNNNNKNNINNNKGEDEINVNGIKNMVDEEMNEKNNGNITDGKAATVPTEVISGSSSSSMVATSPSISPALSGASSLSKASSTPRVRSPVSNGNTSPTPISPMVKEYTYEERKRERNRIDEENAAADYYANYNRKNGTKYLYDDDRFYKFHINENQSENENDDDSKMEEKESDEYFAGYKILDREAIRSAKGTVRGVKNRVRAGIATFLQKPSTKNYKAKDAGKIVVYITSMSIVRETYFACIKMLQILKTHMVKHEVRDMFMSRELQTELKERIGCESIEVPQLFIDGQYIGNADTVERLNESGELRRMFKPYRSPDACTTCVTCGGCRLRPCEICNGSKKSPVRNDFMMEFYWLRCMNCDEVGLVRCQQC